MFVRKSGRLGIQTDDVGEIFSETLAHNPGKLPRLLMMIAKLSCASRNSAKVHQGCRSLSPVRFLIVCRTIA